MRSLIALALAALCGAAHAEVITITPSGGGSGGGITGPGTTVSGNLVTWNSATGAAIADSGILTGAAALPASAGAIVLDNTTTPPTFNSGFGALAIGSIWASSPAFNASGQGAIFVTASSGLIFSGQGGGYDLTFRNKTGQNVVNVPTSTQNFNFYGNAFPNTTNSQTLGTSSLWWQSLYSQNVILEGSSSGNDTIQSGNTSAQARTITFPNTGNATDTLALLAANQTFSGTFTSSGAFAAPSAAGQTTINGTSGTTATMGATNTGIALGGVYSGGVTTGAAGQGAIYMYGSAYGLTLQGWGTNYDVCMAGHSGSCVVTVKNNGSVGITGATTFNSTIQTTGITGTNLWASTTAPTSSSNAASILANGTLAFSFKPAATTQNYITLTLPTETSGNGWICSFNNLNAASTGIVKQTGSLSTTSVTVTYFSAIGTAANWPNTTDQITALCAGG